MFTKEKKEEIKKRIYEVLDRYNMIAHVYIVNNTVKVTLRTGPLFKNLDGVFISLTHFFIYHDFDFIEQEFLKELKNEMTRGRWLYVNEPDTTEPHSWKYVISFGRWDKPYRHIYDLYEIKEFKN